MNTLFLSTGKAARALGVNPDVIRRLCEAEAIQAEVTQGGQWRIRTDEISRIKREGLPLVPRPLPGQRRASREDDEAEGEEDSSTVDAGIGLLGPPSAETVRAADSVLRLRNQVEALKLKRAHEEQMDWFRSRQADEDARAEEEAAEAEALAAEERERDQRARFQARWLSYAVASIPLGLEGEGLELRVHQKVKDALAKMDAGEEDFIVRRIVDGILASITRVPGTAAGCR